MSVMSDSGSSTGASGEARMLERRVSNNRADLSGDQQMNYFLAWFTSWSELQRADFVAVLAAKMSAAANGVAPGSLEGLEAAFKSMDCDSSRPPTLFSCQVKLFHDWFSGWSDDQKNYLAVRLKDIDADFYAKYEERAADPAAFLAKERAAKDYFEPGIPPELVNRPTVIEEQEEEGGKGDSDNATGENGKGAANGGSAASSGPLSPISEDG